MVTGPVKAFPELDSWSLTSGEPETGATDPSATLAAVDLPDPDSPTRPTVSPGRTSREIPAQGPHPSEPG